MKIFLHAALLAKAMSSSVPLQVKLRSSDNDTFEVPKDVATQSVTVKELLEDTDAGAMIPLPNVTSKSELPLQACMAALSCAVVTHRRVEPASVSSTSL